MKGGPLFHALAARWLPGEQDLDMLLVDGKSQVKKLKLAKVSVQQVASCRVFACPTRVLAETIQGVRLLIVLLRVVLVDGGDVLLQWKYPVHV